MLVRWLSPVSLPEATARRTARIVSAPGDLRLDSGAGL